MRHYTCDRCRAEYTNQDLNDISMQHYIIAIPIGRSKVVDLCPDCIRGFENWFNLGLLVEKESDIHD